MSVKITINKLFCLKVSIDFLLHPINWITYKNIIKSWFQITFYINSSLKRVDFRFKLTLLPYWDSYSEETATAFKKMFTHFPFIKKQMKQIAFENVYKSSIRFSLFLYTHIPDKSPSYALLQRTSQKFKARWFDPKFNAFCKNIQGAKLYQNALPRCVHYFTKAD